MSDWKAQYKQQAAAMKEQVQQAQTRDYDAEDFEPPTWPMPPVVPPLEMPKWLQANRKLALWLVIGAVALLAILGIAAGASHHSKDWYYGDDVSTDLAISWANMGGSEDAHSACEFAVDFGAQFDSSIDVDDAIDGCVAGIDERKPRWA